MPTSIAFDREVVGFEVKPTGGKPVPDTTEFCWTETRARLG